MSLPIKMPFPPMEALSVEDIPTGAEWQYEPKWDGFRSLAFRDGNSVELQSKSGQLLTRYFPELIAALAELKATRFILDGEIVVPDGAAFSFDALLQRIHPAKSRVARLAAETPALFIVFDLLANVDGASLVKDILDTRRQALDHFARTFLRNNKTIRLSPATVKLPDAKKWFARVGNALDGIIAKRRDKPYASGTREAMQKIKNHRSADCVVGGFRYNEGKKVVGSLLLGLYDDAGLLHHVGFTSGLKAAEKAELTKKLERLIAPPGFTGNKPGGPSRWSTKRSAEWQPLRPKLVVEVRYDHFSGDRFRHGTTLLRWRPDKSPRQCTLDQLKQKKANLQKLLA
ncbi:ATP-dependent DNA ligase [Pseudorhodoplanes sinuspersici]|uniref:DNA ligase (ATP) n=1 Tax=Pseudorhodoplanes sinuspersici TaxID=1235591 RepID=A0A1W6ZQ68_9HYPH|nr:ATP-dependent DNA ligase [Pseudorhodoplanes sinuspersici]ARP99548.1 ATP-dependent DNA ligase [Pseudorhodoplanes sinuspersici]RKE70512.1 ATP-dependent DNA ligase [Pseudorhodoplanes sinuspersici]